MPQKMTGVQEANTREAADDLAFVWRTLNRLIVAGGRHIPALDPSKDDERRARFLALSEAQRLVSEVENELREIINGDNTKARGDE